jgi:hypothetical protein
MSCISKYDGKNLNWNTIASDYMNEIDVEIYPDVQTGKRLQMVLKNIKVRDSKKRKERTDEFSNDNTNHLIESGSIMIDALIVNNEDRIPTITLTDDVIFNASTSNNREIRASDGVLGELIIVPAILTDQSSISVNNEDRALTSTDNFLLNASTSNINEIDETDGVSGGANATETIVTTSFIVPLNIDKNFSSAETVWLQEYADSMVGRDIEGKPLKAAHLRHFKDFTREIAKMRNFIKDYKKKPAYKNKHNLG